MMEGGNAAGPRPMLLIGCLPTKDLGFQYTQGDDYSGIVIGSLSVAELLHFADNRVYLALLQGLPVYLFEGGLQHRGCSHSANRLLWAKLLEQERYLKSLGIRFVGQSQKKRLYTAEDVRQLLSAGQPLPENALLTPLARDMLEGK